MATSSMSLRLPASIANGIGPARRSAAKMRLKFGPTRCRNLSPYATRSITTRDIRISRTTPACPPRRFARTTGPDRLTAKGKRMSRNKLDRRRFLQSAGTGLAGLTLATKLRGSTKNTSSSQRRLYALNHNWLYREQAQPNATVKAFDDSGFKRVTIPHTNKILPWHGF